MWVGLYARQPLPLSQKTTALAALKDRLTT